MKRIKEVIKQKAKKYHARRIYGERQVKYFLLVACLLIGVGLFIEYGYYSTIGHLGKRIAFEIFKIHITKLVLVLGYAYVLDLLVSFIVRTNPQTVKEGIIFPFKRPTFLFSTLLILMFSLDAPVSVFYMAITVMTIFLQNTKKGHTFYPFHPLLIGYLIGAWGIIMTNYNLGLTEIPPMLSAPYMVVTSVIPSLSFDGFISEYYSLKTVIFGIFEGSLCFTLIIPLLLSALFLMKRQVIDYKVSLLYLAVYVLVGIALGMIFKQPNWLTMLFLLNGSVLITGIFILSDVVILDRYSSFKYGYVIICALLSVLLSYFIHFVFSPYLAVALVQVVTLMFDFMKRIIYRKKLLVA